ncbi:thiol peroxidase [Micromonospora sp. C31]|uniref:thiol peroxidase n=1 Tax=Micromonospora sp. C31 TaxID=2824876 RepID=UPI001B38C22C|nr:thiol peroxidase [Micromonospora sp. C31]MBQ1075038.1 thiol peroxidase [Micromonospora sp. C31]
MTVALERAGVTTFRGRPVTLLGPEVRVGDPAPAFTALANDFSPVDLASSAGTVRILSVVPSLDTGVCDQQTRRFNEEAAALPGVSVLTISVDLPFAQARWCGAAGIEGVRTASDHRDLSFGLAYGVVIAEFRLLARAVFVVDAGDRVVHVEYVREVGEHPRYEEATAAARSASSR